MGCCCPFLIFSCVIALNGFVISKAEKQRAWIEQGYYFEGILPSSRTQHGFTSAGQKMYTFGGITNQAEFVNELHVFNPDTRVWTELTHGTQGTRPPGRCCLGFSAIGDSLFVFGGYSGAVDMNDLFRIDTSTLTWTNLTSQVKGTLPKARKSHGFVSSGDCLFVFGGWGGNDYFNDIWMFNQSNGVWTSLTSGINISKPAPVPRIGAGLYVANDRLIVYGGFGGSSPAFRGVLADVWTFNLTTRQWTMNDPPLSRIDSFPVRRYAFGLIPWSGKLYIFGGVGGSRSIDYLNDLVEFDPINMVWTDINIVGPLPPRRIFPGIAVSGNVLYIFAGNSRFAYFNGVHRFNLRARYKGWLEVTSKMVVAPPKRTGFSMTSTDDSLYVFGGNINSGTDGVVLNDLWGFDVLDGVWKNISDSLNSSWNRTSKNDSSGSFVVPYRRNAGFTSAEGRLFLFSGYDQKGVLSNEFWEFDPKTNLWTNLGFVVQAPSPRYMPGFTSVGGKLYLLGGQYGNDTGTSSNDQAVAGQSTISVFYFDFHSYDIKEMIWTNLTNQVSNMPPARFAHCFISCGGNLYLFGGRNGRTATDGVLFGDLQIFNPVNNSWTDLTKYAIGRGPTARMNSGLLAMYDRALYVFGGYTGGGFVNDLFMFDTFTLTWSELTNSIKGSFPSPRRMHGFSGANGRIFVYGGIGASAETFDDLRTLTIPKIITWPTNSSAADFVDIYDWDKVYVNSNSSNTVPTRITLCTGFYPCAMEITGRGRDLSFLKLTGEGALVCWASTGCSSLKINALSLLCDEYRISVSAIQVDASSLIVKESSFSSCVTDVDGAIIQAYSRALVAIESSVFADTYAAGFGGAISAVDTNIYVYDSNFSNCKSRKGGGAIWVSMFNDYHVHQAGLVGPGVSLKSCAFENCSTSATGGAILLSSGSLVPGDTAEIYISSSVHNHCSAAAEGGAIRIKSTETSMLVTIANSNFSQCTSGRAGGAVSADSKTQLLLQRSHFMGNSALGLGGGALHMESNHIRTLNCSFSGNQAFYGGGGVILFDGSNFSETDFYQATQDCRFHNDAAYGPCFASTYDHLDVSAMPAEGSSFFAGLPVRLSLKKKDAFNQTITSDSTSLVQITVNSDTSSMLKSEIAIAGQVFAKLYSGESNGIVEISPRFSKSNYSQGSAVLESTTYLSVTGSDSERMLTRSGNILMTSTFQNLPFSSGDNVCPVGYVLNLNSIGNGVCSKCGSGSYSLTALSACLPCIPKGNCSGGRDIMLPVGTWTISGGMYKLIGCPERHQLLNSVSGAFNHDIQQCVPCKPSQIVIDSNNPESTCYEWSATYFVALSISLSMSKNSFSASKRFGFAKAVASTAAVSTESVQVSQVTDWYRTRRVMESGILIDLQIASINSSHARAISEKIDQATLMTNLRAMGFENSSLVSNTVQNNLPDGVPVSLIAGVSIAGVFAVLVLFNICFFAFRITQRELAYAYLIKSAKNAKMDDEPSRNMVPFELKSKYEAVSMLGISNKENGCILKIQSRSSGRKLQFAIKIKVPNSKYFQENEMRKIKREAHFLEKFSAKKCNNLISLANFEGNIVINSRLCWFVLDLIDGNSMKVTAGITIEDHECIQVARSVLAALKEMHSEDVIHCDVQPSKIMLQKSEGNVEYPYKLIDFGCAQYVRVQKLVNEVHETELGSRNDSFSPSEMSKTSISETDGSLLPFAVTDDIQCPSPEYMSPEMWNEPSRVSYPADIWSLGVSLFELVTGSLPFIAENKFKLCLIVAGNMNECAPSVLEKLTAARRAKFDHNVAKVIGRALEKDIASRYSSADEMFESVFQCLISRGEAVYSVFISYRVASEFPLAQILFDELNHSLTPGGHRVTVFWDVHRLVKGECWEDGFATGLLNSLCIFPLLSYGSTAPLACVSDAEISAGWEEKPVNRERLKGEYSDCEDNVLKELTIATAVLMGSIDSDSDEPSKHGAILKIAYPILVGRQEPYGHPKYPRMGSFFPVQGGGGKYPDKPSPPTLHSVLKILKDRTDLPGDILTKISQMSVRSVMAGMTKLQGCQLWDHSDDLEEIELSKDQLRLIGKGSVGPAVDLGGIELSPQQKSCCTKGFNEKQLRMLKAEVRAKIPDFHEVIDRAVAKTSSTNRGTKFRGQASSVKESTKDTAGVEGPDPRKDPQKLDFVWETGLSFV